MTLYDELPALDSRKATFLHTSPILTPIHIHLKKTSHSKKERLASLRKTGLEISHEMCLKLESSLSLTQLKKNVEVIDSVRDESANQLLKTN